MTHIETLRYWHQFYNKAIFNEKLSECGLGFTRSRYTDGYYEHFTDSKRKPYMRIARRLLKDEETLLATIIHEMIHQYQHEVLNMDTHHDSVFRSIARHLERRFKLAIRT